MGNWSDLLWETLNPTSRVKRDLILQCSTSASTIYWDFCFSSTFLATKCISPIPTHCWSINNICTWQCQRGHNSSGDLFKLLRSKKRGTHFKAYFSLPEQCKALHFKHNLGPGLHVSYWSLYLAMIRHSDTQHRKSWFLQNIPVMEMECQHWAMCRQPTTSLTTMLNGQKKKPATHSVSMHDASCLCWTSGSRWRMTFTCTDSFLVFTWGNRFPVLSPCEQICIGPDVLPAAPRGSYILSTPLVLCSRDVVHHMPFFPLDLHYSFCKG